MKEKEKIIKVNDKDEIFQNDFYITHHNQDKIIRIWKSIRY